MTLERLHELQRIPVTELQREALSDVDEIVIDPSKSRNQRVEAFLRQTKNPFAMNVGDYILQIGYMEGAEKTLDDCMIRLAKKQTELL